MKSAQPHPQADQTHSAAPSTSQPRQAQQASPDAAAIAHSPRMTAQRQAIRAAFGPNAAPAQLQGDAEQQLLDEMPAPAAATQRVAASEDAPNLTGMPSQLKSGIEALSGMDMSDVRVHRNSNKPAQLSALAYAQGNDIHLGPGQERHLGHEAWHVVQQRQGRVKATMQMAGKGKRQALTTKHAAQPGGQVIQKTEEDAVKKATALAGRSYSSFERVMKDKERFTAEEWSSIVDAYNTANSSGLRLRNPRTASENANIVESKDAGIVDRSGATILDKKLSSSELKSLIAIKTKLSETPEYESFLVDIETRVRKNLGMVGFQQLYRGGHIVLNDSGAVYKSLVATYGALMKPRYTSKKQTSHYTAASGFDISIEEKTPQMGLDFPAPLNGHVLIGIVPPTIKDAGSGGSTFLQTEMYGFQDVFNALGGHGIGFVISATGGGNSGLVGYSPNSEKQGREIREVDNN